MIIPALNQLLVSVNLPAGNQVKYRGSGIMDRSNNKSSNIQSNLRNMQLKISILSSKDRNNFLHILDTLGLSKRLFTDTNCSGF